MKTIKDIALAITLIATTPLFAEEIINKTLDASSLTPFLRHAAHDNNIPAVHYYLMQGADANDPVVIESALRRGDINMLTLLICGGADHKSILNHKNFEKLDLGQKNRIRIAASRKMAYPSEHCLQCDVMSALMAHKMSMGEWDPTKKLP